MSGISIIVNRESRNELIICDIIAILSEHMSMTESNKHPLLVICHRSLRPYKRVSVLCSLDDQEIQIKESINYK